MLVSTSYQERAGVILRHPVVTLVLVMLPTLMILEETIRVGDGMGFVPVEPFVPDSEYLPVQYRGLPNAKRHPKGWTRQMELKGPFIRNLTGVVIEELPPYQGCEAMIEAFKEYGMNGAAERFPTVRTSPLGSPFLPMRPSSADQRCCVGVEPAHAGRWPCSRAGVCSFRVGGAGGSEGVLPQRNDPWHEGAGAFVRLGSTDANGGDARRHCAMARRVRLQCHDPWTQRPPSRLGFDPRHDLRGGQSDRVSSDALLHAWRRARVRLQEHLQPAAAHNCLPAGAQACDQGHAARTRGSPAVHDGAAPPLGTPLWYRRLARLL